MNKKLLLRSTLVLAGMALGAPAMAAVSAADAAKLGAELTPLGAEKAGNADGSIPAWDGGLTSASQAGFANFRPASITRIRTPTTSRCTPSPRPT
jgi:hypothetical protein